MLLWSSAIYLYLLLYCNNKYNWYILFSIYCPLPITITVLFVGLVSLIHLSDSLEFDLSNQINPIFVLWVVPPPGMHTFSHSCAIREQWRRKVVTTGFTSQSSKVLEIFPFAVKLQESKIQGSSLLECKIGPSCGWPTKERKVFGRIPSSLSPRSHKTHQISRVKVSFIQLSPFLWYPYIPWDHTGKHLTPSTILVKEEWSCRWRWAFSPAGLFLAFVEQLPCIMCLMEEMIIPAV